MMDVGKLENVMSRLLIDYWLRTKFSLLNVKSTALRVAILRWHKSFLNRTRPWFILNCTRTLSPDLAEEVLGSWIILYAQCGWHNWLRMSERSKHTHTHTSRWPSQTVSQMGISTLHSIVWQTGNRRHTFLTDRKWEKKYINRRAHTHTETPLHASAPTWLTESGVSSGPRVKLCKQQSDTHTRTHQLPSRQGARARPSPCLILFVCFRLSFQQSLK